MNNILRYSFSKRQKALLLALAVAAVAAVYVVFVQLPVSRTLEDSSRRSAELSQSLEEARAAEAEYLEMKLKLEEILSQPGGPKTFLPDYDNLGELMTAFDGIFRGLTPELRADSVKTENGIAERSVSFGFTAESFFEAERILRELSDTGFRSQIRDLSVSALTDDVCGGEVKVTGSIVFYELAE